MNNLPLITKKIYVITIVVAGLSLKALAQPHTGNGKGKERIENVKIGMISNAMNLTVSQAEKFWPIYNAYSAELKTIRKGRLSAMKNARGGSDNTIDDATAERLLADITQSKQLELDLQRKYQNDFLKVVSSKQLLEMYAAEKRFNAAVTKRIMDRRNNTNGPKGPSMNRRPKAGNPSLNGPR